MKKIHTAVIGISFDADCLENLNLLIECSFLKEVNLHFVHVSRLQTQLLGDQLMEGVYPESETQLIIEQAVTAKLDEIAQKHAPALFNGVLHVRCLFSLSPKKAFKDYADKVGANFLILLAPQEKKINFGSFITYQTHHSKANLLVLRRTHDSNS